MKIYFRNNQYLSLKNKIMDWEGMWSRNGGLKPGQAFDASQPLPFLDKLFEKNIIPKELGFIPGCGRGYEVG